MSEDEDLYSDNIFFIIENTEWAHTPEAIDFRGKIKILDFIPGLNLMNVQATMQDIQEIIEKKKCHLVENNIVAKIEPFIFQKIKAEINDQGALISALVDVEPYDSSKVVELGEIEGIEIKKEYPFISAVHVSFPVSKLLDVAMLGFVNRISDSKGQIVPLGGVSNGQD